MQLATSALVATIVALLGSCGSLGSGGAAQKQPTAYGSMTAESIEASMRQALDALEDPRVQADPLKAEHARDTLAYRTVLTYNEVREAGQSELAEMYREGAVNAGLLDRAAFDAAAKNLRWAELMKRTFDLDLLRCECGARREVSACILEPAVARKILRHLGLPYEPPASSPSRAPPVLQFA